MRKQITMNALFNNPIKQCIAIFLIHSILTTNYLCAMQQHLNKLNNQVTVINEHNDPLSSLNITYHQIEPSPNSKQLDLIGMNTILNAPTNLKCRIARNQKGRSFLMISDPRGYCTNEWYNCCDKIILEPTNEDKVTIQARPHKNKVVILLNGFTAGSIQY